MMCFSCKPEWFQYTIIEKKEMEADSLLRVRMDPSVCVELWSACNPFGAVVRDLSSAIRDSRLARAVPKAEESFDMFTSKTQLCNWAHNIIALHPFKQPSREEQDIPTPMPAGPGGIVQRRLDAADVKRSFDVMREGRATGFQ